GLCAFSTRRLRGCAGLAQSPTRATVKLERRAPRRLLLAHLGRCGSSLQRNDAGVWLCEYPGLSFQRSPVCACSLVSSLLLSGASNPLLRNQLILSDKC